MAPVKGQLGCGVPSEFLLIFINYKQKSMAKSHKECIAFLIILLKASFNSEETSQVQQCNRIKHFFFFVVLNNIILVNSGVIDH